MSVLTMSLNPSSPAIPATGKVEMYFKNDGYLYIMDETGTETKMIFVAKNNSGMGKIIGMEIVFGS